MKEVGVRIGKIKVLTDNEFMGIKSGSVVEAVIVKSSKGEVSAVIYREVEEQYVTIYSFDNELEIKQFEIIDNPFDGVPKEVEKVYGKIDYREKYEDAVNTIKEMSKLL